MKSLWKLLVIVALCIPFCVLLWGCGKVDMVSSDEDDLVDNAETSNAPGDLTIGINGGEYWGYTGITLESPESTKTPRLSNMITSVLGNLCYEKGYNFHITLYRNLVNQKIDGEVLPTDISVDELMKKTVSYFTSMQNGEQVFIIYLGERNEVAVHVADPDFPDIDLAPIEAAFCDETISDPIIRVQTAIEMLGASLN